MSSRSNETYCGEEKKESFNCLWKEFRKIPFKKADGSTYEMIELVVVKGNLLFLEEIFKDFYSEVYLPHFFELCWTPNYNRAVRHHLQSKDKRFSYDFASTHSHKPSSSRCCQRFRTTNIEVFIVDSQPTEGITIRRNLVQNKEEHKMEVQFKTFPKRKVASWFIYTSTKPSATIHNVAESHILKGFDTANRDILECPTFDPDDLRLDQQSFLSSAVESQSLHNLM